MTVKTQMKAPRANLRLESLEERANPSSVMNGDLYIYGTNSNDQIQVRYEVHSRTGYYKVSENNVTRWYTASTIWGGDVYISGFAGNDTIDANAGLRVTAYGNDGNDLLMGSGLSDYLDGGNGMDWLWGYAGHDTLVAGDDYSFNTLHGMDGNDTLLGGYGRDVMYGNAGDDYLSGSEGNDNMYGGTGYDQLYGGKGNDVLDGGDDGIADYLLGGAGRDSFQRDMYRVGRFWFNRDYPSDFTSGDSFYG